jgi:predicted TIM-barrel fold metal-dependent hydrolase
LANPWLDFLSCGADAVQLAREINDELQETSVASCGRIYGFGVVALQEGVAEAVREVERLSQMSGMRGIILGTRGLVSCYG